MSRTRRAIGILLVAIGFALVGAVLFWPQQAEHLVGGVVGAVRQEVQQFEAQQRPDGIPAVTLGGPGGLDAIDTSPNGTFVEMEAYRTEFGLQPVFAAHNGSGGDIILPWTDGQEVDVTAADGITTRMRVTDTRVTPQDGVSTTDLLGLRGSIVLQSCFWTGDVMRFVALTPLGEEPVLHEGDGTGSRVAVDAPR